MGRPSPTLNARSWLPGMRPATSDAVRTRGGATGTTGPCTSRTPAQADPPHHLNTMQVSTSGPIRDSQGGMLSRRSAGRQRARSPRRPRPRPLESGPRTHADSAGAAKACLPNATLAKSHCAPDGRCHDRSKDVLPGDCPKRFVAVSGRRATMTLCPIRLAHCRPRPPSHRGRRR